MRMVRGTGVNRATSTPYGKVPLMGQADDDGQETTSMFDSLRAGWQRAWATALEEGPSWAVQQWLQTGQETPTKPVPSVYDYATTTYPSYSDQQPRAGVPSSVWIVGGLVAAAGALWLVMSRR